MWQRQRRLSSAQSKGLNTEDKGDNGSILRVSDIVQKYKVMSLTLITDGRITSLCVHHVKPISHSQCSMCSSCLSGCNYACMHAMPSHHAMPHAPCIRCWLRHNFWAFRTCLPSLLHNARSPLESWPNFKMADSTLQCFTGITMLYTNFFSAYLELCLE